MATIICKNCGNEFEGNFCNNCGQKSKTARLDWAYLNDEAKYTFLHLNGGLLFTIAQLFKRPGHAIREFVDGKRVNYYKPVLLLFVVAGFYGLLAHNIDFRKVQELAAVKGVPVSEEQKILNEFLFDGITWWMAHYSLVEILILPIVSFLSWMCFRSYGYNYVEHVILNAFTASQRLLITIGFFPITWFYQGTEAGIVINNLVAMFLIGVGVWSFIQFFRERDMGIVILRYILFMVLIIALACAVTVPLFLYILFSMGKV